jgi:hypothetical protein
VWSHVHDDVVGGMSLAEALAKWPKPFSAVYVAMVRAGEAVGFLHVVLQQIADFRTREQELKGKVNRLAAGLTPEERQEATTEPALLTDAAQDAVAALEALDVRPVQARKAVALALDALGPDASVEALVREGLKIIPESFPGFVELLQSGDP